MFMSAIATLRFFARTGFSMPFNSRIERTLGAVVELREDHALACIQTQGFPDVRRNGDLALARDRGFRHDGLFSGFLTLF